jgi:hypothetical protein
MEYPTNLLMVDRHALLWVRLIADVLTFASAIVFATDVCFRVREHLSIQGLSRLLLSPNSSIIFEVDGLVLNSHDQLHLIMARRAVRRALLGVVLLILGFIGFVSLGLLDLVSQVSA